MIRRLLTIVVLAAAGLLLSASPAGAGNGNIVCVYSKDPAPLGLCIASPWG